MPLFTCMMNKHATWGRHTVYMTWQDRHFPSQGCIVFRYLKTIFSLDIFISVYSGTITAVLCHKSCLLPTSILPNLVR